MLQPLLAALEHDSALSRDFAARCKVSEQLDAALSTAADPALRQLAERVVAQLDAADERFFARVRARLRAGKYTRPGMTRSLWRHAEREDRLHGYAPLDVLLAGLFDAGELPDELPQAPEMVAYQPAPGRVILSLLAEVRDGDVVYDLGSGLGRVVLSVSLLTAARLVRGVEFQPGFCAYSAFAAGQVGAQNTEFLALDARDASYEDGTLFFLYTPFRGSLLQSVLTKLHAVSARRAIRICSFGPCTAEIATAPWLELRSGNTSPDALAIFDSLAPAE